MLKPSRRKVQAHIFFFSLSTPFHPGYLTAELIEKAKNLKLAVTGAFTAFKVPMSLKLTFFSAGVGSDHIDLNAANKKRITVAEITGSNVVSVSEHVVMT